MFDLVPLGEAARKVADRDPALATGEELMADVLALEVSIRALESARTAWLAELDRRGTTDAVTGHRTAAWFAGAAGCARASARRMVRAGRRLDDLLPAVAEAHAVGAVSSEHVQVLSDLATGRTADVVAACQEEFLALAAVLPFERWRAEVRGLVDLADTDGGFRPGPDRSTLRLATGFGGSLEMAGTFVGGAGQVLRESLDRAADRLRLRYRDEVRAGSCDLVPDRSELMAEALADLVRRGVASGRTGQAPVVELTLVAHADDPLGVGCQSATTVDIGDEADRSLVPSPVGRLRDGAPVGSTTGAAGGSSEGVPVMSDATARELCCDPALRTVVLDSLGNPVDLGRRTRLVPPGLRRALLVRDGGCTFPGCDAPPSWCDLHHVQHWADGGSTSAENLVSLCRHHHGVSHRSGWTMRPDPVRPQRFVWHRPDGTVVASQRRSDAAPRVGRGELRGGAPPPG